MKPTGLRRLPLSGQVARLYSRDDWLGWHVQTLSLLAPLMLVVIVVSHANTARPRWTLFWALSGAAIVVAVAGSTYLRKRLSSRRHHTRAASPADEEFHTGPWGDLVTAVVVREDDRWKVSRWIDAELEPGDGANTLDDVIRIADASVRDSYPPGPRRTSAELQYAIYPWKLRGTPTAIFDITGTDGGLIATDILERNPGIRGKTADDLVAQASLVLARQDGAMFRWVKNVNDLAEEN